MSASPQHNDPMQSRKRVAIVGLGNVGQAALEALLLAEDMELAGVVRRRAAPIPGRPAIPVADSVEDLGPVDGAILCGPTRLVTDQAIPLLERGIYTVDSFDIHGTALVQHRERLGRAARAGNAAAVVCAGWDPGTDSVIRALFSAMVPQGKTYTTFGPGMSMGHSVAARAVPGVRDAVSMTIPAGPGKHRREVYVELEEGADPEVVARAVREDPYFANDPTEVFVVERAADRANTAHGVQIIREGSSGIQGGQRLAFAMRIDNPALTAQVMVDAMRAAFRQPPGAYTLLEVPPIDLLPGEREPWIRSLV